MQRRWLHLFQSAGIAAASIDGTMDAGYTARATQQTSAQVGYPKVLTSCSLIGEGVDVPSGRRLHLATAYGQRWAPPADDWSVLAPTT
jgi:hypothetical protein